jgi:hypothetical protein
MRVAISGSADDGFVVAAFSAVDGVDDAALGRSRETPGGIAEVEDGVALGPELHALEAAWAGSRLLHCRAAIGLVLAAAAERGRARRSPGRSSASAPRP